MENNNDLIKILIPAVGGQGGGVMTEWLVQAFFDEHFDVQGISLPGLSQRGGSTVYYLEAHPRHKAQDKNVVFAQYPMPGDVDVILSQEFLELGRALELGYGSDKTTIVTSTHRIYSTLEKMPLGSGIYQEENLRRIAEEFSREFIGIDALELAKINDMDELAVNAILLGALAALEILPINKASFIGAIGQVGVAVTSNIKAFEAGYDYVTSQKKDPIGAGSQTDWDDFVAERAEKLEGSKAGEFLDLIRERIADYPDGVRQLVAESTYRLIDYQAKWYGEKYLDSVDSIYQLDKSVKADGFVLTKQYAKNLGLWMGYEDGIRVSELKINSGRFKQIMEGMRIKPGQVFRVVDYLKPDAEEVYGLFPNILVAPIMAVVNSRVFQKIVGKRKPLTMGQTPTTTSFTGFMRLWFLTKFKFIRPYSYRYKQEHRLIKKYDAAIRTFAALDYNLGVLIASSASMIKGYGRIRRRTIDAFLRFIDNIMVPITELDKSTTGEYTRSVQIGERSLKLISESTEGIDQAETIVQDELERKAA